MSSESPSIATEEAKKLAEERRALRKTRSTLDSVPADLDEELVRLNERAHTLVAEAGGFRELLKYRRQTESMRPLIHSIKSGRMELRRQEFQVARAAGKHGMTEWAERKLGALDRDINGLDEKVEQLRTDPESAVQLRMVELSDWRDQLKDGYAVTHSRQEYLDRMQSLIQSGKPIFLKGPTGTGKTELARALVHELYGRDPEIVRGNPNVQEWTMIGQTGLRETEKGATETVFDPGPLVRALEQGIPVIIDEFNQIDPQVRFVLKELYNRKPGDCIPVPNNETHCIKEGFAIITTANLGARYEQARFPLDDAEERVFLDSTIDVGYLPAHELYDLCLSSLVTVRGDVPVSSSEASFTLKRYCDAVADIQRIYTGGTSAFDMEGKASKGIKQPLEKTVIDPGLALRLVRDFSVSGAPRGVSLAEHLARRVTDLLANLNSDSDRNLMAKVFSQYGIIGASIGDLAKTAATRQVITSASMPTSQGGRTNLRDVALLDPYQLRGASLMADAEALGVKKPPTPEAPVPVVLESVAKSTAAFLRDTFQNSWSYNADQLAVAEQNLVPEIISPHTIDYPARKTDVVAAKSGEYTLNSETIGIDWDAMTPEQITARTEIVNINTDPDFKKLADKSMVSVAAFIINKYGSDRIPGLELEQRLYELGDKAPEQFKDGKYHFFFGSLIRVSSGDWVVPCAGGNGGEWGRYGNWIESDWGCRVPCCPREEIVCCTLSVCDGI